MTYDQIMALDDLAAREQGLKTYYEQEVKVGDWLVDQDQYQCLVFRDRTEYKYNNQYHSLDGPAIKNNNGTGFYYIHGQALTPEEWKPVATRMLRELKLNRTLLHESVSNC